MVSRSVPFLLVCALVSGMIWSPPLPAAEKSDEAKLQEGIQLGRVKKYVEAEQVFLKLLQADPMNDKAHYYLGISYWKTGKKNQAGQEYGLLMDLNPTMAANLSRLCPGIEKGAPGPKPKPVADPATGAIPPVDPVPGQVDPETLSGLEKARALAKSGRGEEAAALFRKEIQSSANPDPLRLELGQILEDNGLTTEAIVVYNQVETSSRPEAVWRIARIHRGEGRLNDALTQLNDLVLQPGEFADKAKTAIHEIELEQAASRSPAVPRIGAAATADEDTKEKERQKLWEETNSDDDKVKEQAYLQLIQLDPSDRLALEGMKDLMKEQNHFYMMRKYLYQMVREGHISQSEADEEINNYEGKKD